MLRIANYGSHRLCVYVSECKNLQKNTRSEKKEELVLSTHHAHWLLFVFKRRIKNVRSHKCANGFRV